MEEKRVAEGGFTENCDTWLNLKSVLGFEKKEKCVCLCVCVTYLAIMRETLWWLNNHAHLGKEWKQIEGTKYNIFLP